MLASYCGFIMINTHLPANLVLQLPGKKFLRKKAGRDVLLRKFTHASFMLQSLWQNCYQSYS